MDTAEDGQIILIDKPLRWTSFEVVKRVRSQLGLRKVGHAGTLDPLATGLLILCTGKKTKLVDQFMDLEKEYIGRLQIGRTTPSVDLETSFDSNSKWDHITASQCLHAASELTGQMAQIPPIYSAVRISGKRAYKSARKGEAIVMRPRWVDVTDFELTEFDLPNISFRVVCSKGTYIRSLVRDFGEKLGTGAYLSVLRRTRIGELHVDDAQPIDELPNNTLL